jgi:hypothetical protein
MSTTPLLEHRTLLLLAASNVSLRLHALLFIDGSFEHHLLTTRSLSVPPHRDPVDHPHALVIIRTRSRGVIDGFEPNSPPTDSVAPDNPHLVVLGTRELLVVLYLHRGISITSAWLQIPFATAT